MCWETRAVSCRLQHLDGAFFIDMPHKEFGLLVKLYHNEKLSESDLNLFEFIIKDFEQVVKDVTEKALNNYLPLLKSKLNYSPNDGKAIFNYLKQTIIKTIYEEKGYVFNYFFYGSQSFKKSLNIKVQEIINSSTFHSNVFIQSLITGIGLKKETIRLKKANRDLLSKESLANKFIGKKVTPEKLALYEEIKNECKSLEQKYRKGHQTSLTVAVKNVLYRKDGITTSKTSIRKLYTAYWSWQKNQNK